MSVMLTNGGWRPGVEGWNLGFGIGALRAAPPTSSSQAPTSAARSLFSCAEFLDDGLERLDDFFLVDARLGETELEPEGLGGRLVAERVVLRSAGLGLGGLFFFADGFSSGAVAGDFLDQGDHFLGVSLPNYL